jgi:hypothetical protein
MEEAMCALAKAHPPKAFASQAFPLHERFRPELPKGSEDGG